MSAPYLVTCRGRRGGKGWSGKPGPLIYLHGGTVLSQARWRSELLAKLRAAGNEARIVGFVHGFNVDHDQALKQFAVASEGMAAVPGATLVGFSWPSEGQVTRYLDDRGEARFAAEQLAVLLNDVRQALEQARCPAQLNIIAHSMGNYVLGRAARYAAEAMGWPSSWNLFSEVIMLAPDLNDQALEERGEAHELPVFCRRLTVYWTRHDNALLASSAKRGGVTGGRLGRTGPAATEQTPEHVVSVDCSAVVKGHSAYLREPAVIADVQAVISGIDRSIIPGRQASPTRVREWSLERPQPPTPGPLMVAVQQEEATT